nr:MAG TPA: antitoxin [Caudoviricetes sp.]
MRCQKCGSSYIGRTFTYSGTFIVTQYGEQISDNLTPVPSSRYWRCLDCNAQVTKVIEEEEY